MTSLQVIGAGLGRTGTLSLQSALETLGYGPCHHMKVVLMEPSNPLWSRVEEGDMTALREIYQGYKATVDYPGCVFYKQFLQWNPDAKVILSVRDNAAVWEESCRATIFQPGVEMPNMPAHVASVMKLLKTAHAEDPKLATTDLQQLYNDWNQAVIDSVPADRLLLFNVKEGWGPLCSFLGVAEPDCAFPRVNDRATFIERRIRFD